MRNILTLSILLAGWLITGCQDMASSGKTSSSENKPTAIQHTGQAYVLLRHGKPYFIQGGGGKSHFERLQACGGNSIRIWDDIDAEQILDQAQKLGLTVLFGLWVERETDGFDYHDQEAVDRQYERIRKTVLKFKNHPAVLMWCVGNEWAQDANSFGVFDEVNRLAALVHELDPDHPTTTAISPDSGRAIWLVRERCPEIDVLSVNAYGIIPQLPQLLEEGGWTKPYLISEFGAKGYWEEELTPWRIPIEPSSTQKIAFVRDTYRKYIGARFPNCLGSYLFYWGAKQEETETWFSLFDEKGRETPLVGLMEELWTGHSSGNRAPVIGQLRIDDKVINSLSLPVSATTHRAQIQAYDPDIDSLSYRWEIKPSAQHTADYIGTTVPPIAGLVRSANAATTEFILPQKPGIYRLFVFVYDTHQHVATANLAFRVTPSVVQ
jgi:hypothetical protein